MENTPPSLSLMKVHFAEFRLRNEMDKLVLFPNTEIKKVPCTCAGYVCEYLYTVAVVQGIYAGKTYRFRILVPEAYPFMSPKVKCLDQIYHPNIDYEGNVCLEFLRHQWSSAMGIEWITIGIHLFLAEPQGEEALNTEAGDLLIEDYRAFVQKAQNYQEPGK